MKFKNIALIALASVSLAACSKVEPGHVGIRVHNFGSDAGVEQQSLGVGYYYAGPGTSIHEYPVFTNTYTWTRSTTEQSTTNEEFAFSDKNGLQLTADVAVSYHVNPEKASVLFQKYRMDMDAIIAGPVRSAIRNYISNEASQMGVEEIYGPRRAELANKALVDSQKYFEQFGLHIEQINWASPIRVPEAVMKQINQKIANEQAALAAQASVATAEAEAKSRIAQAEGQAKATQIEANAISSNPQILTQRMIEKWDGHYPQYVGGGMPLPTLGVK
jgi:regulator of protease activity HflC (stomatin/prohibitin superfamily)